MLRTRAKPKSRLNTNTWSSLKPPKLWRRSPRAGIVVTMGIHSPTDDSTRSFGRAALRQSAYRQLSGRPHELGADPARLRKHLLYRRSACDYGLPEAQ